MEGIILFFTKHLAQNPEKITFLYFVIFFLCTIALHVGLRAILQNFTNSREKYQSTVEFY